MLLGLTAGMAQAAGGGLSLPLREVTFEEPLVSSYWGRKVQPLAPGESPMPGSYRVRAEVAPRMSDGHTPDEGIPLVPSGAARPDPTGTVLELLPPAGTRLRDFSELLTEYGGRRSCHPDWSAVLRSERPGGPTQIVQLGGRTAPAADEAIIMAERPERMEWAKKDYGYLARRVLGLAPDARWRYAQDGGFTAIQRRLDIPLRHAHTIELEFPGKTVLSGVNLSIAKGPGLRTSQLLLGNEFSSRTDDDGTRTRVSLYLDDALADRAKWGDNPHLAEIIVSYQGSEAEVARDKPLRSMRVLGYLPQAGASPSPVDGETWTDEASGNRLARRRFSLEELDKASRETGTDLAAVLVRTPPGCGSHIARVWMIKPHSGQTEPLFQTSVRRQLEKMGGPFLPADAGSQEWLQWEQWLPFSEAHPRLQRTAGSDSDAEFPGWGVRLQWSGTDPRMVMSKEGLAGTGISAARLQWDMDAVARPDLRIFAGMLPDTQSIGALDAELRLDSGAVTRFQLVPNRAQLLPEGIPAGSRIRSLTLHIASATGMPQAWTLASLGVFRPYLVSRAHLAEQPRPGWRLLPQALVQGTHTPQNGTYRWESHPSGVRAMDLLQIHLTHTSGLQPAQACWLAMEARSERGGQVRVPLCPTTMDWQTGLAERLLGGGIAPDEKIQTLTWTARLSAPPLHGSLRVALGVTGRPSANDTLSHGLPLQLAKGEAPLLPSHDSPRAYVAPWAPLWLDYGSQIVSSGQVPSEDIWQDDDLFELRRITWVADKTLWPALEEQRKARLRQSTTAAPHPEAGLRLQSAWLILFAAVVFFATARSVASRRPVLRGKRAIHAWGAGTWNWIHRTISHLRLPQAASVFTAVATGLALFWIWMAGRKEADAALFLASGLLALLAACVRLSRMAHRLSHSRSPVRAIVAVVWLAVVAWLLGSLGFPKQPLTSASLVAACLLWMGLPDGAQAKTGTLSAGTGCLLMTKIGALLCSLTTVLILCGIGLYALGLSIPQVGRRENVWITMAAIVMVAAWWRAARSALPALKCHLPRCAPALHEVPGGGLFAGALVVLVLSCVALWFGRSTLAAHLTTLCFYLWCAGALVTAVSPWARPEAGKAPQDAPRCVDGG